MDSGWDLEWAGLEGGRGLEVGVDCGWDVGWAGLMGGRGLGAGVGSDRVRCGVGGA